MAISRGRHNALGVGVVAGLMLSATGCFEQHVGYTVDASPDTVDASPDASDGTGPDASATALPTPFLSDQKAVSVIAADDQYVYWLNSGWKDDLANWHPGAVRRMPHDGSGAVEDVAPSVDRPGKLVVGDTYVYWSAGDGSIWRAAKSDLTSKMIVGTGAYVEGMAVNSTRLYYYRNGLLASVAKDGTAPDSISLPGLIAFTVDDADIYWFEDQSNDTVQPWRQPIAGGTGEKLVANGAPYVGGARPILTQDYLYVLGEFGQAVTRIPLAGGNAENVFLLATALNSNFDLVGSDLYVLTIGYPPDTRVTHVNLSTVQATIEVDTPTTPQATGHVAVGPAHVYFTLDGGDAIYRIPR